MQNKRKIAEIQPILTHIKIILQTMYKQRLLDLFLYGSFAKNNATENSDIDIAIILDGNIDKLKEIDKISDSTYSLMLETNELFSFLPVSKEEFYQSRLPIYYNIKTDGIKI